VDSREGARIELVALGIPVKDRGSGVRGRGAAAQDRDPMAGPLEMSREGLAEEARPARDEDVQPGGRATPRRRGAETRCSRTMERREAHRAASEAPIPPTSSPGFRGAPEAAPP